MELTVDQIEEIIDWVPALDSSSFTNSYSGRGMYGKQCIGWEYSDTSDFAVLCWAIGNVLGDDQGVYMLENVRLDNMGLDMIAYFPGYTCPEWEEDDDDDYDY